MRGRHERAKPGRGLRRNGARPLPKHVGRSRLVLTLVGRSLFSSGITVIAVAVAAQEHPPQPALSAAGSLGPSLVSAVAPSSPAGVGDDRTAPDRLGNAVAVLPPSPPVAIDIPAIGVDSTLQHLGLTPQNTLAVPAPGPNYDEAAWYDGSATPGSVGPAVIVGHVDSVSGGPSVFFDLGGLQPGDRVEVTRADSLVAVFRVHAVRRYPKDDYPTLLVHGDTREAALRLITCGGAFEPATGHYRENIIVFASLVDAHAALPRTVTAGRVEEV